MGWVGFICARVCLLFGSGVLGLLGKANKTHPTPTWALIRRSSPPPPPLLLLRLLLTREAVHQHLILQELLGGDAHLGRQLLDGAVRRGKDGHLGDGGVERGGQARGVGDAREELQVVLVVEEGLERRPLVDARGEGRGRRCGGRALRGGCVVQFRRRGEGGRGRLVVWWWCCWDGDCCAEVVAERAHARAHRCAAPRVRGAFRTPASISSAEHHQSRSSPPQTNARSRTAAAARLRRAMMCCDFGPSASQRECFFRERVWTEETVCHGLRVVFLEAAYAMNAYE